MYIAVTAEESGLIGSEFYTENPLVPLEKTAAVINIDALYPMGRAKDVEVIGYGASELEGMLAALARKQGRTLMPDRKPEAGYFYRSDHFNFAKAGVPALYIKSGAVLRDSGEDAGVAWQEKYVAERYHKPGDEYADAWNVSGSIEDLKLLFEVGARVANSESWPEWNEGNEFRAARDKSAAARAPAGQ
jgi:Zn-dependent M28 family amino/carboxypeptidase